MVSSKFWFAAERYLNPLDLAPTMWLDSTKGLTLSGSNVTAWADQSGNGNNVVQATGANQPVVASTIVGNAIQFAGNQWLTTAANVNLTTTDKLSLFVVANYTSTGFDGYLFGSSTAYVNFFGFGIGIPPGAGGRLFFVDTKGNVGISQSGNWNGSAASTARRSFVATVDRALTTNEASLYMNGVAQVNNLTSNANNTDNFANDKLTVGAAWAATVPARSNIYEVMFFNRLLTSDEIARLSYYSRQRYTTL